MNKIQERFLQLLLEVDAICKKHDITYYLAGGTALGAVRNAGFLPWDDDVDLYITRDNWERLEQVIDDELRPDRELVSAARYENYRNPIGRYVDLNSSAIMLSQALSGSPTGLHVEFLIMDPVPKQEEQKSRFLELLLVYTELLTPYFVVNRRIHREGSHFNRETLDTYLALTKDEGLEQTLRSLESELFSCRDSDDTSEYYSLRWGLELYLYRREYFGEPRLEDFEGHRLPVARHAEGVFREAYGDTWMMVPVPELQETHNAIRSLDISYVNYLNDYLQFIDQESALTDYEIFKQRRLSLLDDKDRATFNDLLISASYEELLVKNSIDKQLVVKLYKSRNYQEVLASFERYLDAQLSPQMLRWDIFVDIGPEYLAIVLDTLIHIGRYHHALQILKVSAGKHASHPQIDRLNEIALALRALSIARFDTKCEEDVQAILDQYGAQYPRVPDLIVARLELMARRASSSKEVSSAALEILTWVESNPNDWDLYVSLGDLYLAMGSPMDAESCYEKVLLNSRNGILLRHVMDQSAKYGLAVSRTAMAYEV